MKHLTETRDLEPKVGLVVALDEEFAYVMSGLERLGDLQQEHRVYYRFRVPGSAVMGVLTVLDTMGLPNAGLAVRDLVHEFNVSLVALVGTAAALDADIPLGDVVIASEIIDYGHQAKVVDDPGNPGGYETLLAGTNWKPSAQLSLYVQNFHRRGSTEESARQWAADCREACRLAEPDRPKTGPGYRMAKIASGDAVVGSEEFKKLLKRHDRKITAVEMEAGGAALAAHPQEDVDLLVVRGVSDHAGGAKTATDATLDLDGLPNAWRRYAVTNAIRLLTTMLVDPGFPWRTREAGTSRSDTTRREALDGIAPYAMGAAGALPVGYAIGRRMTEHLQHDQELAAAQGRGPRDGRRGDGDGGGEDDGNGTHHPLPGSLGHQPHHPDVTADSTITHVVHPPAPHHPGDHSDMGDAFDAGLL